MRPSLVFVLLALAVMPLGGCAFISSDETAESLRASAEHKAEFNVPVPPGNACARVARMLMWCAGGPNFHYRCSIAQDGGQAQLSGVLEAVYRTEVFMVTDFTKTPSGSAAVLHQHDSVLLYDYAPLIEKYLVSNQDCRTH